MTAGSVELTATPVACAPASAGVKVTPVPALREVTPLAWAFVSPVASVMPVPAAPAVPTAAISAVS